MPEFPLQRSGTELTVWLVQDAVRNSVCHTATVIANSLMHCGTTSDQFLRWVCAWRRAFLD